MTLPSRKLPVARYFSEYLYLHDPVSLNDDREPGLVISLLSQVNTSSSIKCKQPIVSLASKEGCKATHPITELHQATEWHSPSAQWVIISWSRSHVTSSLSQPPAPVSQHVTLLHLHKQAILAEHTSPSQLNWYLDTEQRYFTPWYILQDGWGSFRFKSKTSSIKF